MTWEEAIIYIRSQPDYAELVEKAYLDSNLKLNVERFMSGEEWKETLRVIKANSPGAVSLLDVGSGNGISAIAFALNGYIVTAVEPDSSETVGAGAIRNLAALYNLSNITVIEEVAENLHFDNMSFDIVYCRQSMHHAADLKRFVKNTCAFLKSGGLFLTVRDHVILNKKDKDLFLLSHPVNRFYGGENGYRAEEYRLAFRQAGLVVKKEMKYFDSIINYFPVTQSELLQMKTTREEKVRSVVSRLHLPDNDLVINLFSFLVNIRYGKVYNEKSVPGRMYSYLAEKK